MKTLSSFMIVLFLLASPALAIDPQAKRIQTSSFDGNCSTATNVQECLDALDNYAPDLSSYLTSATAASTYAPITEPLSLHLDQTTPQTITGLSDGYLKLTSGVLGSGAIDLSGYVPTSRTLTINGTSYDLSADRSWTITSMIYPGAGIAKSTGSGWDTSISGTSSQFVKGDGSLDSSTYALNSALANYVPYTGATTGVDLGSKTFTTTGIVSIGTALDAVYKLKVTGANGSTRVNAGSGTGEGIRLAAGNGGANDPTVYAFGGTGGATLFIAGNGGASTGFSGSSVGGSGGAFSFTPGIGGIASLSTAGAVSGGASGSMTFNGASGGTATAANGNANGGAATVLSFFPGPVSTAQGGNAQCTGGVGIATGGQGGTIQMFARRGGTASGGATNNGGNGGSYSFSSGTGGAATSALGTLASAGNAGAFTLTGASGGAASGGGTNDAGDGSSMSMGSGIGGNASGGTSNTGGNGGSASFSAGSGGNGTGTGGTGGTGGSVTFTAGLGGTGTVTNGANGNILFKISSEEKIKILGATGNIGIAGIATPTARIHIAAGSATAGTAPIKFTSGTLTTAAVAGQMEFLTDDYYLTISNGAARQKIVMTSGLTSGKYPIATTNGRLTDGVTPLSGTKTYYVSDTSGGSVTRKLTFTNGILTAET